MNLARILFTIGQPTQDTKNREGETYPDYPTYKGPPADCLLFKFLRSIHYTSASSSGPSVWGGSVGMRLTDEGSLRQFCLLFPTTNNLC